MAYARVVRNGNAAARQGAAVEQIVEHKAGGAARHLDGKRVAAEVLHDARDVAAAPAGVIALVHDADLVDRANGFRLALAPSMARLGVVRVTIGTAAPFARKRRNPAPFAG